MSAINCRTGPQLLQPQVIGYQLKIGLAGLLPVLELASQKRATGKAGIFQVKWL